MEASKYTRDKEKDDITEANTRRENEERIKNFINAISNVISKKTCKKTSTTDNTGFKYKQKRPETEDTASLPKPKLRKMDTSTPNSFQLRRETVDMGSPIMNDEGDRNSSESSLENNLRDPVRSTTDLSGDVE